MAELVDALDSGSSRGNSVEVRLFLAATYICRDVLVHSTTKHDIPKQREELEFRVSPNPILQVVWVYLAPLSLAAKMIGTIKV